MVWVGIGSGKDGRQRYYLCKGMRRPRAYSSKTSLGWLRVNRAGSPRGGSKLDGMWERARGGYWASLRFYSVRWRFWRLLMVRASEQDGEVLVMLSREGGLVRVGEDT